MVLFQMAAEWSDRQRQVQTKVDLKVLFLEMKALPFTREFVCDHLFGTEHYFRVPKTRPVD